KEAIAPHLDGAWECGTCLTFELVQSNLCAARAEAERWKQQHEALRAGVERVANRLRELWRETCQQHSDDALGRMYALDGAEKMLRHLLSEAGGGERD